MTKFFEVSIFPSAGGFGEHECQPINGAGWVDADDLLSEICSNIDTPFWELGVNDIEAIDSPEPIEDIRGRVRDAPARIFAYLDAQSACPRYFGIVEF